MRAAGASVLVPFLVACGTPTKTSVIIDAPPHVAQRAGPPMLRGNIVAEGDDAVVHLHITRDCVVSERRDRIIEERRDRDPSLGLLIAGGAVGASGLALIAFPGSSCDADELCVADEKQLSQVSGFLLLVTGVALAVGGLASEHHERSQRTELGRPVTRRISNCSAVSGRGLQVRLVLSDGTELSAAADTSGIARIPISDDEWSREGGVLRGTLVVGGRPVQKVELRRGARPSQNGD